MVWHPAHLHASNRVAARWLGWSCVSGKRQRNALLVGHLQPPCFHCLGPSPTLAHRRQGLCVASLDAARHEQFTEATAAPHQGCQLQHEQCLPLLAQGMQVK